MEGRILDLKAPKYTIGRKSDRDLCFKDDSCSGEHAELRLEGGEWKIVGNDSRNGTWLNKKKVTSAVLVPGRGSI
jgi:pSer/pThr/pTyr-binding forkhead associated (FHA) protein